MTSSVYAIDISIIETKTGVLHIEARNDEEARAFVCRLMEEDSELVEYVLTLSDLDIEVQVCYDTPPHTAFDYSQEEVDNILAD